MEESKRKQIEEQLRQMMVQENQTQRKQPAVEARTGGVKVIRRRKGAPDHQIR